MSYAEDDLNRFTSRGDRSRQLFVVFVFRWSHQEPLGQWEQRKEKFLGSWSASGCLPPRTIHLPYYLPTGSQPPSNQGSESLEISLAPPECFEAIPPENKWTLLKLTRKSVLLPVSNCMGNLPKTCSPELHHSLYKNHILVDTL